MNVFREILKWSQDLPMWQRDGIRRIVVSGHLSTQDEKDLLTMLTAEHGFPPGEDHVKKPVPFSEEHLPSGSVESAPVTLLALHSVRNVNALVDDQTLPFSKTGLTVIYGDNAAGKSGYVRVLKRACRAREREDIRPNVYGPHPVSDAAEAVLVCMIGQQEGVPFTWRDGEPSDPTLAAVSVFDSKCSRFYVTEKTESDYRPYGMDVFDRLCTLCGSLKDALQVQRDLLVRSVEEHRPLIKCVLDVLTIGVNTAPDQIDKVCSFSDADQEKLDRLAKQIAKLSAEDPAVGAQKIRRGKRRVEVLTQKLRDVEAIASNAFVKSVRDALTSIRTLEVAALAATSDTFKNGLLPGFGEETWRALFEAAERYSVKEAYPNEKFPFTREGARCVLCQQPLTGEGATRLRKFREYLEEDLWKKVEAAHEAFQTKWALFSKRVGSVELDVETLAEIEGDYPDLAISVKQYAVSLENRTSAIKGSRERQDWGGIPPLDPDPFDGLTKMCAKLEGKASELDKQVHPEVRGKMHADFASISAQKERSNCKVLAHQYLECLRSLDRLDACIKATNTLHITVKAKSVMAAVMTRELAKALKAEIDNVGFRVPVSIKQSEEYGKTYYRVSLADCTVPGVAPTEVLSEGEQCILGIVAFLAELEASQNNSSVIFDDPVCSLDHEWRPKIAARLVDEGAKRQVIIFTHDLFFLNNLKRSAEKKPVSLDSLVIRRTGDTPGYVSCEEPWKTQNVEKRVRSLKERAQKAGAVFLGDPEEYRRFVKSLIGDLRDTWERAVEQIVLGSVINRYNPDIHTKQLKDLVIDEEICRSVEKGMSDTSPAVHDEALAANAPPLTPDNIKTLVDDLSKFCTEVKAKQEAARDKRTTTEGC